MSDFEDGAIVCVGGQWSIISSDDLGCYYTEIEEHMIPPETKERYWQFQRDQLLKDVEEEGSGVYQL